MQAKMGLLASILMAMGAVGGLLSATARPDKNPDYTRKTARSYTETLNALQEAAKGQGFKVSGVHDLQAALQKEGYEHGSYAVVEICRADLAFGVLKAEPRFGAFMPCRIAVYQVGSEGTVVTTVLPTRLLTFFPEARVKDAAKQVDAALISIIDTATK
jgi:uncharacterized protein (DUF302 family)